MPKSRLGSSRRVRRALILPLAGLTTLLSLHFGGRRAVAAAVANAPNAGRAALELRPLELPPELAARGGFIARVRVGPPEATLVAWVVPGAHAPDKGTVLLLHGIRMDKRSLIPMGEALVDAGYRAVLVDLRGHGESTGRYLTYGAVESRDLSTVLDFLAADGGAAGPVGAYGFSYGAAVALELGARDSRVRAVVAVSPFSSLREVMGDYERKYLPGPLRLIPDAWFQSAVDVAGKTAGFDPDSSSPLHAVANSNERLLLIHGSADTQVPPRHSRELADAAGSRARLVTIAGAGHDSMPADASGVVRRETIAWFDRQLAATR